MTKEYSENKLNVFKKKIPLFPLYLEKCVKWLF